MSNQLLSGAAGQDDAPVACCTPMVHEPLGESDAAGLSQMFKALSDPVRLRLLSLIASHQGGQVCVCDLTGPFDVSKPTISHHLKVLREAGLVGCERRGTWVYYWVLPAALHRLSSLLQAPLPAAAAAGPAEDAAAGGCCG
jgi:ArsR family transcriptional regulator, arsenate/arsenite/antimonite-responsive transcriptional repressor